MTDLKETIERTVTLTNAIREYKMLSIEYNGVKRSICPSEIRGDIVKAYQIGTPDAKEGWRSFKIQKIEKLSVSKASFDPGFSEHFKKF
jgi:hypothetical protein